MFHHLQENEKEETLREVRRTDASQTSGPSTIHYTHSTIEEIFGVTPMLGDAANVTASMDLFVTFPYSSLARA